MRARKLEDPVPLRSTPVPADPARPWPALPILDLPSTAGSHTQACESGRAVRKGGRYPNGG
jgi:hypothetical protein